MLWVDHIPKKERKLFSSRRPVARNGRRSARIGVLILASLYAKAKMSLTAVVYAIMGTPRSKCCKRVVAMPVMYGLVAVSRQSNPSSLDRDSISVRLQLKARHINTVQPLDDFLR